MSRRLGPVASLLLVATACGSTAPSADETPASAQAQVSYRHFDINHVLSTGLGDAVAIDAAPPITVAQPYTNLKFDTGVIPARQCDEIGCRAYAKPSRFVPLIEGDAYLRYGVETMSSGLANEAARLAGANRHDMLVSVHTGSSAQSFALLGVQDAKSIAEAAGKSYVVRAVTLIAGESDHAMLELQRDYEIAVQAITGQTLPVPLLVLQHRVIPVSAKVVVVAPSYPIGYADDGVHFTNHGQRRIGEYFGKAYTRIVTEGKTWEPLRPIAITRSGKVIRATFLVPRPPLVLDTDRVTNPGSYGFEFADDSGAPPAIRSVALAGADTVEITLAHTPGGRDQRLRYAYTATPGGARGNLRDSDDTPSNHDYALWNWSVHFDERVE